MDPGWYINVWDDANAHSETSWQYYTGCPRGGGRTSKYTKEEGHCRTENLVVSSGSGPPSSTTVAWLGATCMPRARRRTHGEAPTPATGNAGPNALLQAAPADPPAASHTRRRRSRGRGRGGRGRGGRATGTSTPQWSPGPPPTPAPSLRHLQVTRQGCA
jgi:hypothetical protein